MTRRALALLLLVLLAACAAGPGAVSRTDPATHTIAVTSNDWHTRIVVAVADIPDGLLPERRHLPAADWLAIGWGDRDYYPRPDPPLSLAMKAALLPGPAVIHLVPLAAKPRSSAGEEVLALAVGEAGFRTMLEAIHATIERPAGAPAAVLAPGLYPESRFFAATGRFHLLNTCNSWTARQLVLAGLPIRSGGVVTAEELMAQLRGLPIERPALG